jgi:hypothetical protein
MLLAGAAFAASWCLPVAEVSGDLFRGTVWGWKAFLFAVSPALGNDLGGGWLFPTWMVASALSNLLAPAVVGFEMRPSARAQVGLAWALGAGVALDAVWAILPSTRPELRLGYYLWLSAFVLAATAMCWRLRRARRP